MKNRSIAFVIEALSVGGAERLVVELANRLQRSWRWDSHVICLTESGDLAGLLDASVDLHVLDKSPNMDFSMFNKLSSLMSTIGPSIINSHLWTANTWVRTVLRNAAVPIVVTEHNRDVWKRWHHKAIDRWLARYTKSLIAVSHDTASYYEDDVGIRKSLITVINNGIDVAKYEAGSADEIRNELGISADTPLIGTVGRLNPQKNHLRFIDSMQLVWDKYPKAHALIAGGGPLRTEIADRIDALDVGRQFHMLGTREDVPSILQALDIFILSSDREGHPLSALEAQAAGAPVVLTNVGGSADAIASDGERAGGILVAADAESLATGITGLLGDKEQRLAMSDFAKLYAHENFGVDTMVGSYNQLFDNVLAG